MAWLRVFMSWPIHGSWPTSGARARGSRRRREVGDGGNPLLADDFEAFGLVEFRHVADRGLDPHAGQPAQAADDLANAFTVVADVELEHGGLLDLVVVAADGLAMLAQDLELVRKLRSGEEVAGLRVLRDQAERFLLATAPDQDRWMRAAQALRHVERPLEPVVLAIEWLLRAAFALPHREADL